MNNLFFVFLGGGLGSIARYGISEVVKYNFKTVFPTATLCSNIISCVILGLAVGLFYDKIGANQTLRMLVIIGFCGGFSTFSSFSFETVELMRTGNIAIAIANILISVSVCVGLIYFLSKQS